MSQESTYSQVQSVLTVRTYAESVAPIVNDLMNSAPIQIAATVQKIQNTCNTTVSRPAANILQSPASLKVLNKHFKQNMTVINRDATMKNDEVSQIKAAAIMTMRQENLKIENKLLVMRAVNELMTATTVEQTKDKLASTFAVIKNEHTKVFTNTLSSAVQLASSKVGFANVKSEIVSPSLTRIVATNPQGYNLISEIHTDEKSKIDIQSELEGITDGSCKKIMDDFNKELETLGIVAERKDRKPTGGIAQMPYTKKLQKQRNSTKREFVNETVIKKDSKNKAIQYINN
jgi:hypothetical protein